MLYYIVTVFLVTLSYVIYQKFKRRNLPPGPIPLPLVGNLIEIARAGGYPYETFAKLSNKYGNIYSVQIGVVSAVVLTGNKAIRTGLKSDGFDNRNEDAWLLDRSYGKKLGIVFSEGNFWKETRGLVMNTMRDFGFGKRHSMEFLILDEFEELIKKLKTDLEISDTILVQNLFNGPMINIIWSLVTGSRYDLEDPHFKNLIDGMDNFSKSGQYGGTNLVGAFPFLAHYLPGITGFTNTHRITVQIRTHFENLLRERRALGHYKTDPSNVVDRLLYEGELKNGSDPVYSDENLVSIINDLFITGTETSGNLTSFAIRQMVQYPEIQRKMQEEIDRVVGKHRMVTWADKSALQYCDATIMELFKFCNVVPLITRRAAQDCKLESYDIPKGTILVLNFHSAHMEPSYWGDPQNFRPERFLNKNGDLINADKVLSFSLGKRNCFGEVTARTSIFLAITNLVKTFSFEVDPKSGMPGSEVICGFSVSPKPFSIRLNCR